MKIAALDHVNIEAVDIHKSAKFYEDILGLKPGARPPFDRDGYWMYCEGKPIIHIITPMPENQMLTGSKDAAISHYAMQIDNYEEARDRLAAHDVKFEEVQVPDTELKQLFFPDPDGVLIELIFIPESGRI